MIYLAWAGFYEGGGDRTYYAVLLPRVMEEIIISEAIQQVTVATTPMIELGRNGREVDTVATEICLNKDQIHLLFIHADTGGRASEDISRQDHRHTAKPRKNAVPGIRFGVSS